MASPSPVIDIILSEIIVRFNRTGKWPWGSVGIGWNVYPYDFVFFFSHCVKKTDVTRTRY